MRGNGSRRRTGALSRLRKRVRESFLVVPFLGIAAGWTLATGAVVADELIHELGERLEGLEVADLWFFRATAEFGASAKDAVQTMSSAMLTFIGVVFSITLVALQMAGGQLSPRILRLYVESWVTKLTLALFLCTFLYTLRMQREYGPATAATQDSVTPYVGYALAMGFVVASLAMFVVYVHSTIRLMRVTHVLDLVTAETLRMLPSRWVRGPAVDPPEEPSDHQPGPGGETVGGRGAAPRAPAEQPEWGPDDPGGVLVHNGPPGVLQAVHLDRLVALARADDVCLRLVPRVGDYLPTGAPLFRCHGGEPRRRAELRRCVDVGADRTMEQDVAFGLRQLVDIAARALSPGVNDPTTAVQVLDRVEVVLAGLLTQPLGDQRHRDHKGVVRLVEPVPTWSELLDLALTEIRDYGAASPQVSRRLVALVADLLLLSPPSRRPALERQWALLHEAVAAAVPDERARRFGLTPDRQGLG
ncbi:DUF2254 domain-containing protein [Streptomyces durbertensis]|uniref:DUF2254 domain-containing protein n=1 Tax=Streptomyces durbertensis TaxID=2448886 RepID=A0ABR6EIV4_9ACTN|nr:DUF2254 domain-containing protein [Streptomyces durbertensis]MBB1245281.1 DUF2254 domain-containing protein [Streptomyces durbertensis]